MAKKVNIEITGKPYWDHLWWAKFQGCIFSGTEEKIDDKLNVFKLSNESLEKISKTLSKKYNMAWIFNKFYVISDKTPSTESQLLKSLPKEFLKPKINESEIIKRLDLEENSKNISNNLKKSTKNEKQPKEKGNKKN